MQREPRETFAVEYSIDELKNLLQFPLLFKPVNFYKGVPIHLVEEENISGEVFKQGDIYFKNEKINGIKVEASNYGRIKIDNQVRLQTSRNDNDYDYLHIPSIELPDAHRIIAFIWNSKPTNIDYVDLIVHHINNNGYDNRPCNLLWVTYQEHKTIHTGPTFRSRYDHNSYNYV